MMESDLKFLSCDSSYFRARRKNAWLRAWILTHTTDELLNTLDRFCITQKEEIAVHATTLLIRFLSTHRVTKQMLSVYAGVCLTLSTKLISTQYIPIPNGYKRIEIIVLEKIGWNLCIPTPFSLKNYLDSNIPKESIEMMDILLLFATRDPDYFKRIDKRSTTISALMILLKKDTDKKPSKERKELIQENNRIIESICKKFGVRREDAESLIPSIEVPYSYDHLLPDSKENETSSRKRLRTV